MTLQVWASAALIVAASVLIGDAIGLLGARCRAAGPAVGLCVLIVLADLAIKLPGRAVTAGLVLAVVTAAATVLVVIRRRRARPALGAIVTAVVTAGIAAFGAAIPLIANGRVGLLGVSLDNDTANHMIWAEALRTPIARQLYGLPPGYPLGPHSFTDAISSGLGVRLDLAFSALLIATIIITALVASAALRREHGWKRVVVGVLAALFYLVAAYYAEGAFKETLMGLILIAVVLQFEEVRAGWVVGAGNQWLPLLPASVLIAGSFYVYSYVAAAWLGLTFAIWVAGEVIASPGWLRRWRVRLWDVVPPALIATGVLVILLLPNAGRIASFVTTIGVSPAGTGAITTSNLGNLAHALSPFEALGIWDNADFRFAPVNLFSAGALSAFALGILLFGIVWSIGRRELLLPAATAACAIVYWRASHGQSPYVSAKALVIAGPVVAVITTRALLTSPTPPLPRWIAASRLLVAIAFVVLAVNSAYQVLRSEPVWPPESTRELLALDHVVRGQTVLFLGDSDYAPWLFDDSQMSALSGTSVSLNQASPRPNKPWVYGTALDFDSVDPLTLNHFQWVITPNTTYASQPPAAFRLVRQMRMYQLWQRVGVVAPRSVIEASGAPGAVLNCRQPAARTLSREAGEAAVMATPVHVSLGTLSPGGVAKVNLALPAGQWSLSLQYTSPVNLDLSADGRRWHMPAYLDRPGPLFAVGSIGSDGTPIVLTVRAERPSALTGPDLVAFMSAIAATRLPDSRTMVPLRRACGKYVDWFRLG